MNDLGGEDYKDFYSKIAFWWAYAVHDLTLERTPGCTLPAYGPGDTMTGNALRTEMPMTVGELTRIRPAI
jgi:hypothetical protein